MGDETLVMMDDPKFGDGKSQPISKYTTYTISMSLEMEYPRVRLF